MATYSLEELTTPLSVAELKANFYAALATAGVTTTTWKPGAVTRTIIAVVCVVLHALSVLISNLAKSGFLPSAVGSWLTLLTRYGYNVERQQATFATGTVLVSNSSATPYTLDPDELEFASSITSKGYRNTESVTIAAGAIDVPVAARADEAGAASSALIGEIDRVLSAQAGLTVRNAEVLAGFDAESDEAVKARADAKLEPACPDGPAAAAAYFAERVRRANGSLIGVAEVRPVVGAGGRLDVYVRGTAGPLSAEDLALVEDSLDRNCGALCVTMFVHNATPVPINVTYEVWAYRGSTGLKESDFKAAVSDTMSHYLAGVGLGGFGAEGRIYHDDLRAEINQAKYFGTSLRIFRVVLSVPSGDVPLAAHEYPTLGTVSGKVNVLGPPRGSV